MTWKKENKVGSVRTHVPGSALSLCPVPSPHLVFHLRSQLCSPRCPYSRFPPRSPSPFLHCIQFFHGTPSSTASCSFIGSRSPSRPCPLFLTQSVRKCNIKNIKITTSQKYVVQHRKTCTATSQKYVVQHQKIYAAISKIKYCSIEKICTATSNKHGLQHMLHHLKW